MERQRGDAYFCLEASYQCCIVCSRDSSETIVLQHLERIPHSFQKNGVKRGVHQAGLPVVIAGCMTAVYNNLETHRKVPYVKAVSIEMTLVWVASFDLICCRWFLTIWLGTPLTNPNFDPNYNCIFLERKNV